MDTLKSTMQTLSVSRDSLSYLTPHSSGDQEKTFNEIMKMAQEVEQVPSFDASTHGDIRIYCVNFRETRSLSMK